MNYKRPIIREVVNNGVSHEDNKRVAYYLIFLRSFVNFSWFINEKECEFVCLQLKDGEQTGK